MKGVAELALRWVRLEVEPRFVDDGRERVFVISPLGEDGVSNRLVWDSAGGE